ncbi:MAG TPA: hypothetical protein VFW49_05900 [Fluviicoccus sp.]|nr:hypothetical protein [Fluviicoccus sp.]
MPESTAHWPWYVAEFVVSETRDNQPPRFTLHAYLVWAHSVENAYINAKNLELALGEKLRAAHRGATGRDDVAYHCLGIHNLNTLHVDHLENGIHLSVVDWPSEQAPEIREMHELALYQA